MLRLSAEDNSDTVHSGILTRPSFMRVQATTFEVPMVADSGGMQKGRPRGRPFRLSVSLNGAALTRELTLLRSTNRRAYADQYVLRHWFWKCSAVAVLAAF